MRFEGKFNSPRKTSPSELVLASTLEGLEAKNSRIKVAPAEEIQEDLNPGDLSSKDREILNEAIHSVLENQ